MSVVVALLREALEAEGAPVRCLLGVRPQVYLKLGVKAEAHGADVTGKGLRCPMALRSSHVLDIARPTSFAQLLNDRLTGDGEVGSPGSDAMHRQLALVDTGRARSHGVHRPVKNCRVEGCAYYATRRHACGRHVRRDRHQRSTLGDIIRHRCYDERRWPCRVG